jgi:CheY-like chemotaxis protein
MTNAGPIVLVEDDDNDVLFVRVALEQALIHNTLRVFDSAERTRADLPQIAPLPALVILDMHLAGAETGLDVLTWIRRQPEPLGSTPALMLTGSDRQEHRRAALRLGAIAFLHKPVTAENLVAAMGSLGFAVHNNMTSGQLGIRLVRPDPSGRGAAPMTKQAEESGRFLYVRDDARRRIRVTATVPLGAPDIEAIFNRQAAEGTWSFDILYDLRAIHGATTRADANQSAELLQRYVGEHGRRGRVAVVTREIRMLGIAQGYARDGARDGVAVEVFWDLPEAEDWLDRDG